MPNTPGGQKSPPPSMEKRLPLALALMMLVLLVSQYIFKPAPAPKPVKPVNDNTAAKVVQKPGAAVPAAHALPEAIPPPAIGEVQAASEITTDIDTELYHIVFSNRGAVVKSWVLKNYKDDAGKPLQLTDPAATDVPSPFSLEISGAKPALIRIRFFIRSSRQPTAWAWIMSIRMVRRPFANRFNSARTVICPMSNPSCWR